MFYKKKPLIFLLIMVVIFNLFGCNKKEEVSKNKQINIYVDIKDKESLNIIKVLTDEYKKENSKVKVNLNNAIGEKIEEDISKGNEADVIFTSRNNMLKLGAKGLLSDMGSYYEANKLNDRYYTVVKAYGRFNDRYYGIAAMPYTIEVLYNKDAFDKLGLKVPTKIDDVKDTLKKLTVSSKKVPVVLTEDIDINNGLFSIIANNMVTMRKLESIYNSGAESYKSLTDIQQAFDILAGLVKSGSINKNTFEIGNESTINKFVKGDIPIIITSSYYADNFKDSNIKTIGEYSPDAAQKLSIPVIANGILSVPVNNKNGEEVSNFIKFVFSDETQKKLVEKGFVTGNKKANTKKEGIKANVIAHLENSTEDSIAFIYNIPEKLKNNISSKIDDILSGKHTKNEWKEAVEEAY